MLLSAHLTPLIVHDLNRYWQVTNYRKKPRGSGPSQDDSDPLHWACCEYDVSHLLWASDHNSCWSLTLNKLQCHQDWMTGLCPSSQMNPINDNVFQPLELSLRHCVFPWICHPFEYKNEEWLPKSTMILTCQTMVSIKNDFPFKTSHLDNHGQLCQKASRANWMNCHWPCLLQWGGNEVEVSW